MLNEELIDLSTVLNEISVFALGELRRKGFIEVADLSLKHKYKNFERMPLKKDVIKKFNPWASRIDISSMAIELFIVKDEATEIHIHKNAYAVITILGEWEGVEEPNGAVFYFGSKTPCLAKSMVTLQVIPNTLHGFHSPEGANPLTFLSIQSKGIEQDYHPI